MQPSLAELLRRTETYIIEDWHRRETRKPHPQANYYYAMANRYGDEFMDIVPPTIKIGMEISDLTEGSSTLSEKEINVRLRAAIPNKPGIVFIDLCSGIGLYHTKHFAETHPHVPTILVDSFDGSYQDQFKKGTLFEDELISRLKQEGKTNREIQNVFEMRSENDVSIFKNRPLILPADPSGFISALYDANHLQNVEFVHRSVGSNLDDVIPAGTRHVTAWRAPGYSAIGSVRQAVRLCAQTIIIAPSALELATDAPKLSTQIVSTWNDIMERARGTDIDHPRYDYQNELDKKIGFALKHIRALDMLLYLQENGYQTRGILLDQRMPNYNQPEHAIYGFRKKDILSASDALLKTA